MLDLILTRQKYANVTPSDSRRTKYSNPCINNCRQPQTPKGQCFQGLICFVHSPKHACKTSNIEHCGRRGPRGCKGLNISSIYGTGCGRRPETYRRTCVCCYQVMPGSSSYCSYCCHVPCLFPVPFQCLFQCLLRLLAALRAKMCFWLSFAETKR